MATKTDRILGYLPGTFRALPRPTALYSFIDAFGGELLKAENSLAALMRAHWVDHADQGERRIDDLAKIAVLYGLAPRPYESIEDFRAHLKRYVRIFLEGPSTVQGVFRVVAEALDIRIADHYSDLDTWWKREDEILATRHPIGSDAAELTLGFGTANARGNDAIPAELVGTVDLGGGVQFESGLVLKLSLDGGTPVEIPFDAGVHALPELVETINAAAGSGVARSEGPFLALSAPSRLDVLDVPERDAAEILVGLAPRVFRGAEAKPASVAGTRDLAPAVDLREERFLRLALDQKTVAEIDCAGQDPAATTIDEIADSVNDALGGNIVTHSQGFLQLTSPSIGFASTIAFQEPAANDARGVLFGQVAALHTGADPQPARLRGRRDLSGGADLRGPSKIQLQFDGGDPVVIDCAGSEPSNTRPGEIAALINEAVGRQVASHDGRFMSLISTTTGPHSEIVLGCLSEEDASQEIFGIGRRFFQAAAASRAVLTGLVDLNGGLDLFARHLLKISLDGGGARTIDIASSSQDRASVQVPEIVAAINEEFESEVASAGGGFLRLASPSRGASSTLSIEPIETTRRRRFVSRAMVSSDAALSLLGFASRRVQGSPPRAASLTGQPNLSRGADLREGGFLRLAIDGRDPIEIDCAGPRPHATRIEEIVDRINQAFEGGLPIARHDGKRLTLRSPTLGETSRIAFEPSLSADALSGLLGLPPATHRGRDAAGIRLVGTTDLSGGIELAANSSLQLAIDGGESVSIGLTGADPERKTLGQLVVAINLALDATVASHDGGRLILTLSANGGSRDLAITKPTDGTDATQTLFGFASPRTYHAPAGTPAKVVGLADLSAGFDARQPRVLRLSVDGVGREIDLRPASGDNAALTLDQIVEAINAAFRNSDAEGGSFEQDVASHDGNHLVLSSNRRGFPAQVVLDRYTVAGASQSLFGISPPHVVEGEPAAPAVLEGAIDLLRPVDLNQRRFLQLAVDDGKPVTVPVAGFDPAATTLDEVVVAINAALPGVAAAGGADHLLLTSPTRGESSRIEVLPLRFLELIEYPPEEAISLVQGVEHGERLHIRNDGAAESYVDVEVGVPRGLAGLSLVSLTTGRFLGVFTVLEPGDRLRLTRDEKSQALEAVVLGVDGKLRTVPDSQISAGTVANGTTTAEPPAVALTLPIGGSEWLFLECRGDRFDEAFFDAAHFAGGPCLEYGVFGISRFDSGPPSRPVFAPDQTESKAVEILFRWRTHQAGAFTLNLPAELHERFGGRFNQARFGLEESEPESFSQVALSPPEDARFLGRVLANGDGSSPPSKLVDAVAADFVPLGFAASEPPFREARFLTLGSESAKAKLYLRVPGEDGFIEVRALTPGLWGNQISLTANPAGPAIFDFAVHFPGGRFENARKVALGKLTSESDQDLAVAAGDFLKPGPLGLYAAKAAGVAVTVTRERSEDLP